MVNAKPIHLKSAAMDPLLAFKMQRRTCLTVGLSGALLAACGGGGEGGAQDGSTVGAGGTGDAGGADPRPGNGGNPNEKVTMEFRLEDYWKATDVRPGFSGPRIDNLGDPRAIDGNPDADFAPAFQRIMKQLTDAHKGGVPAPARITLTSRVAYHFYSTLQVNHPVEIVGIGVPYRSGSSRMRFHGCSGIHVGVFPAGSIHVGSAYMEGLSIEYVGSNESGNFHGVRLNQTSALTRCSIHNFPGHGLHVEGTVKTTGDAYGNVSMTYVTMCTVFGCGLSGVWIKGKDAQVMILENVNSFANGVKKIDNDGYGFYDASMLGNTYTACHTRNNYMAGYKGDEYVQGSPNRSTYINCYTEHIGVANPGDFAEGPAQLSRNALVITSNGEGNLADAQGGASVIYTDQGRLKLRDVVEVRGLNGVSTIMGDTKKHDTPEDVNTPRLQSVVVSTAYGTADNQKSILFNVHDTNDKVRAWATRAVSPTGEMAYGVTDNKHMRPGMLMVPNGLLIGRTEHQSPAPGIPRDGPRRIGTHDPRKENSLSSSFPNPLIGDIVLCTVLNKGTYKFRGWVFASESTGQTFEGPGAWFRFGEVGEKVGPGTFPP